MTMRPAASHRPTLLKWLPFLCAAGVYALGLRIDPIDVDSAQYGRMAQEMLQTKSFLQVHNRGGDYLDKPPLTFWLAALSYAIFGISAWAYKLPSLLFAGLGILSTYRLTRLFYAERIAYVAALMLSSCVAMFLWTNDVRTDTILLGCVAFALWQWAAFRQSGRRLNLVGGSIGIGLAMLAKGPVGAMVPLLGLATDVILKRDWRWLFSWRWLVSAAICLLLLSPMMWGLYRQFGMNGLRFFFWTQSFGRLTGESGWRDSTTPLFFTHTLLWELLPWTPFFVIGFFVDGARLIRSRFRIGPADEAVAFGGFLFPFVAFSLSHYKLPHYLFVILPLACIIASKQLDRSLEAIKQARLLRAAVGLQALVIAGLWFLIGWIALRAFTLPVGPLGTGLVVAAAVTAGALAPGLRAQLRLLAPSWVTALACGLLMGGHFYPALIKYQAPSAAGHVALGAGASPDRVFTFHTDAYSLDFVLQRHVPLAVKTSDIRDALAGGEVWIYTDSAGRTELADDGIYFKEIATFSDFWVSRLNLAFLRPETRPTQLHKYFLLRARQNPDP